MGATGPATVVRVVKGSQMLLAGTRIARRLNLSGFYGLDFVIDEVSGEPYLVEMNPRCTPQCHLRLGKGRDLVGVFWSCVAERPFLETAPITTNDLIAYYPQAWTCKSEHLEASYQDIPREEPELMRELLSPWPDRSLLFRLANKVGDLTTPGVTQASNW